MTDVPFKHRAEHFDNDAVPDISIIDASYSPEFLAQREKIVARARRDMEAARRAYVEELDTPAVQRGED